MKDEKKPSDTKELDATLAKQRAADSITEDKLFGGRPAVPSPEEDEEHEGDELDEAPEDDEEEGPEEEEEESPPPSRKGGKLRKRFEEFRQENKALKEQLATASASLKQAIDPHNLATLTTAQGLAWQRANWGAVFLAPPGGAGESGEEETNVSPAQLQANIQRLVDLASRKAAADAGFAVKRENAIDKGLRKVAREYRELGYKPKIGAEKIRAYLDKHPEDSVEDAFFATHSSLVRRHLETTRREGASRSLSATAGSARTVDRPRKGKHRIDEALEKKDYGAFNDELHDLLSNLPMT